MRIYMLILGFKGIKWVAYWCAVVNKVNQLLFVLHDSWSTMHIMPWKPQAFNPIVTIEMSFLTKGRFLQGCLNVNKHCAQDEAFVQKSGYVMFPLLSIYDIITFKCSLFKCMKLKFALNELKYQERKD